LFPAVTGSGESVLMTRRSATVPTVVVSIQLLLAGFGSVVVELAVAVLLITVPSGRAALTLTTSVKTKLVMGGSVGSVVEVSAAVLVMTPAGRAALTLTTSVNTALAPLASVGVVAVTVPVPPTAGVMVVQPAGAMKETKVVPTGTTSVSVTAWAWQGPA